MVAPCAFPEALALLQAGQGLPRDAARALVAELLTGAVPPATAKAFLQALRDKGESADEIAGAAQALRDAMIPVAAPPGTMDIVGTGGDGHDTLNISTAVAFIVAGGGVNVAKHGNRAVSGRTGAADTLQALRIGPGLPPDRAEACLRETGLVFLFAPHHHPGLAHMAPLRRELGGRTIFNALGPLVNPAGVTRHLIGVSAPGWRRTLAEALRLLGSATAWVARGQDGMDELSLAAPTDVTALEQGALRDFTIAPEDLGLPRVPLAALKGGDAAANAAALESLLKGAPGAYRDAALLNAAAAFVVAGRAATLAEGKALGLQALDSGAALGKLEALRRFAKEINA